MSARAPDSVHCEPAAGATDPVTGRSFARRISFGRFELFPLARRVERDGAPLALGSRALDILIVLTDRAGEVVGHRELMSRVWRDLVVTSSNLRVHVTSLRRALGDAEGPARYIANVPGQGYCFVAPVRRQEALAAIPGVQPSISGPAPEGTFFRWTLPPVVGRVVGREAAVRTLAADVLARRFVTIVGPGGMGKTTVAVSVAHTMREQFPEGICFVDFGAITDPALVMPTLASTLGLTIRTTDVLPYLRQFLRQARVLLVFDNCEHVVGAASALAEQVFRESPDVHILSTSREALRVEGEHVYRLPPLEYPPPGLRPTAQEAQAFAAVRLFMECAAASGSRFELDDADAPVVARICRRMDGIALAIGFAAGRVGTYGIKGTEHLLDTRFGMTWQGRRTALPRHQTLRALLDWSHDLLSAEERVVFARLAIFVGTFSLEAMQFIAAGDGVDVGQATSAIGDLVSKSLVSTSTASNGTIRYRLLETTREYAVGKLLESGEHADTAHRHAAYFTRLLSCDGELPREDGSASALAEHLGNARAALGWCFGEQAAGGDPAAGAAPRAGDRALGVGLAAAMMPVLRELSLLGESHKWSVTALSMLDDTTRGGRSEMVLQETRAVSSMWTRGEGDDVWVAINRGLAIAEALGEQSACLRMQMIMQVLRIRSGDYRGALAVAETLDTAAGIAEGRTWLGLVDWVQGLAQHFLGGQTVAKRCFERGFAHADLLHVDHRVRYLAAYSRTLWMSGQPDRAIRIARQSLEESERSAKPLNVCFSLLYTARVFLWCGDLDTARTAIDRVMAHPHWDALPSWHTIGLALKGELLVRLGRSDEGLVLLRKAQAGVRSKRHFAVITLAACALAGGLTAEGRLDAALAVIDDALAAHGADEMMDLAELLRLKAEVLLLKFGSADDAVEDCLQRSLDCARRQGALSWELRAATTLAQLRVLQGREEDARRVLATVYGAFTEGFRTNDLVAAERLLEDLGSRLACPG